MPDRRIPDPMLMSQLQASDRPVEWAAVLMRPWQHNRIDGEWSAHQHLFHLLATEREVYQPRLRRLLEEDGPAFVFFDSPGFMETRYSKSPDIEDLAAQFVDARAATVAMLKAAGHDDWSRTATWPDGTEMDLAWFAEKILWYGLDHLATLLDLHGMFETKQAPGGRGSAA